MPKGPQGQKRPADVIGAAVKVMRIATGEEEEQLGSKGASKQPPTAAEIGREGGRARAKKLSAAQRKAIAKGAARKRWGGK